MLDSRKVAKMELLKVVMRVDLMAEKMVLMTAALMADLKAANLAGMLVAH